MCGRFVQKTPLGEIQVLFETVGAVPNMPPRYNAAPTDKLAVVRFNPQTRARALDLLRWGLVPLWAKDPSFGPKCINARSETVATNNIFRDAFERRRCLIPADAFYEWQKRDDKAQAKSKEKPQPYAIVPAEGVFAFAGLWERWKNPADGSILRSFTIVTGKPNPLAAPIHLSDEERALLVELLREAVARDRIFPLPPHVIARAKVILERLEASAPPLKE
jgi:putative SOS response-associated peptidase YedK